MIRFTFGIVLLIVLLLLVLGTCAPVKADTVAVPNGSILVTPDGSRFLIPYGSVIVTPVIRPPVIVQPPAF